jgi:hypothetical protein
MNLQFFSLGYLAELLIGKANGIGHAGSTLTLDNMLNLVKVRASNAILTSAGLPTDAVVNFNRLLWPFNAPTMRV